MELTGAKLAPRRERAAATRTLVSKTTRTAVESAISSEFAQFQSPTSAATRTSLRTAEAA
jgi:hypothetical protein